LKIEEVGKIMEAVEAFCQGECRALVVIQAVDEDYEAMMTLFTLSGLCDGSGEVLPDVKPWRVMGVLTLLYLLRCNRSLKGEITQGRKHGLSKV